MKKLPIEVMSVGTWNGIKFTVEDLKEMAKNFLSLKDQIKPPIKLGHTKDETGAPSYGWVTDLKVIGNKLMAYAEDIPEILMKAIKEKRYRRVSSEVFFDFVYNKKKYGKVFSALALLGAETPAVKDLEDLQAYLLTQDSDNRTFEKLMVFESPLSAQEMLTDKKGDKMSDNKEIQALKDRISSLEQTNKQFKDDNDRLVKEKEERDAEAFEDLKEKNQKELQTFCDDQVKAGKMLPAQRDALVKKVCFSDKGCVVIDIAQFKGYVELAEKVLSKKEVAQDKKTDVQFTDVQEEVDAKVKKYMRENKEEDYVAAMTAVFKDDPDLADRYIGKEG